MFATCHRVNAGQLSCKIGLGAGEFGTCNKYPVPIDAQLTKNFVMAGPLSRPPKNTMSSQFSATPFVAIHMLSDRKDGALKFALTRAVFMDGRGNGPAMTIFGRRAGVAAKGGVFLLHRPAHHQWAHAIALGCPAHAHTHRKAGTPTGTRSLS